MTQNSDSASVDFLGSERPATGEVVTSLEEVIAPRKSRKRKLPKIVSAREAEDLLDSIMKEGRPETGLRNRLMVELMYRAGLRVSEVTKLEFRDIERDGIIRIIDGKGGDGTAYFPPDEILPLLDRWLLVRQTWAPNRFLREHKNAPLFCKPDGAPVGVRYLQRLVKKHKERLGIHGIVTPHVFRHTFATQMLEEGFQLTEVQAALRHAHLATTAVYLHIRDESLRRKMSRRVRPLEREEV